MKLTRKLLCLLLTLVLLAGLLPAAAYAIPSTDGCPSGTPHNWTAASSTPATCVAGGQTQWVCSQCGQTYSEATPALGHDWVVEDGEAPTCTEGGYYNYYCSRCWMKTRYDAPPQGHDWETVETKPSGLTDGLIVRTCRRCQETETEVIPAAPVVFNLARNLPPEAASDDKLIITKDPEGGMMPYGGSFTLTVEAMGGTPPYSYAWHSDTLYAQDSLSASWAQNVTDGLTETYTKSTANFAAAFGKLNFSAEPAKEPVSLYSLGSAALEQALDGASLSLFDFSLGSGSASFAAPGAGSYYCVVRDAAGREAVSETAVVSYTLYIVSQPRDVNLAGAGSAALSCLAGGGIPFAEGDSYRYSWYRADGTLLEKTGSVITVAEPGDYYCAVSDSGDAEVKSDTVTVYDAPPLSLSCEEDSFFAEDTADVDFDFAFTISGGVAPYRVEWLREDELLESFTIPNSAAEEPLTDTRTADAVGEYYYRVSDAAGDAQMLCAFVDWDHLRLSEQSALGSWAEHTLMMSVAVLGGVPPYHYEMYRDGELYQESTKTTNNTGMGIREPGTYFIRVTDAKGESVETRSRTFFEGSEHIIVRQPDSIEVEYEADDWYNAFFYCEALSPATGDDSKLRYEWEILLPGSDRWIFVADGRALSTSCGSGSSFRCKVTDTETGNAVYSDIATVTVELQITNAKYADGLRTARIDVDFIGGVPPYSYSAIARIPEMDRSEDEEFIWRECNGASFSSNGNGHVSFEDYNQFCYTDWRFNPPITVTLKSAYLVIITDSLGNSCQTPLLESGEKYDINSAGIPE